MKSKVHKSTRFLVLALVSIVIMLVAGTAAAGSGPWWDVEPEVENPSPSTTRYSIPKSRPGCAKSKSTATGSKWRSSANRPADATCFWSHFQIRKRWAAWASIRPSATRC